ncbi:MAG: hypothetical protein KME15_11255 [Drouetiella hepatica Uher 2000/2452]|uniref:Uncharacterized protein n=1 Tax=Drouetiella hepatica Uher 2000/2452 TaxID=904376 RepID=A0A951QC97_9CYAN|nr:hypothetical protein [Drouetiella hepatica Uher 2000/2452]
MASVAIAAVAGSHLVPVEPYSTQYEGDLQLSLEPKEGNTSRENSVAQVKTPTPNIDYATQARILWSPKLLSPVIAELQNQYPDFNYDRLSRNLKIIHPEGSRTLEISYQDTDPRRTQAVLERLSQAYLKYSQESPANNYSALQFIEKRVPELQQEVARTQEKLRQFQQHHSANPAQLGRQLAEQSNALTQQQQELQSQLLEARTAYAVLQQRSAESLNQFKNQIFEYQRLESQLLSQQSLDYQELLSQFQETAIQLTLERSHPESNLESNRVKQQLLEQHYQRLSEQLSRTVQKPLIDRLSQLNTDSKPENSQEAHQLKMLIELKVAENQVRMLEISYEAIVQTKALLGDRIRQWAGLARQYDQLQLELQLATNKLNLSLTKQAELQTFVQSVWQVIAPPHIKPIANGLTLSVAQRDLSLSLALCFIVVVWVMTSGKDVRKNRVRSQELLGSPLPVFQSDYQSLMAQDSQPLALELPKVKVLCSIDNDNNRSSIWGNGSLQKISGN